MGIPKWVYSNEDVLYPKEYVDILKSRYTQMWIYPIEDVLYPNEDIPKWGYTQVMIYPNGYT